MTTTHFMGLEGWALDTPSLKCLYIFIRRKSFWRHLLIPCKFRECEMCSMIFLFCSFLVHYLAFLRLSSSARMKQKGINAWKFNFKKFPKDEKLRTTNKKASKRTEEKKNCLRKINGKTHQFSYFAFSPESRQSIRQGNQEAKIKKAVIKAMNFMGRTHKKSLFFSFFFMHFNSMFYCT